MFKTFNKLSTKIIILLIILDILAGASIVVIYSFFPFDKIIFTILVFLVLIIFSSLTSAITERLYNKRLNKKKKIRKFALQKDNLELNDITKTYDVNYGTVQFFLHNNTVFNLSIIKDPDVFFSDKMDKIDFKYDNKKYKKAIQFFVFETNNTSLLRKISIMNYQGNNFYVASFNYNQTNKILTQTDDVLPNEEYNNIYNDFIKKINCVEIF